MKILLNLTKIKRAFLCKQIGVCLPQKLKSNLKSNSYNMGGNEGDDKTKGNANLCS